MSELLTLNDSLFAEVTAAGAYYAVTSPNKDNARYLLMQILKEGSTTNINEERLLIWSQTDSIKNALQLLYRLQRLNFVQGTDYPRTIPNDSIEIVLPKILVNLSDTGRALLADDNGFYMACAGFHHESAEEIAALAGDVLDINKRHSRLLKNNLNFHHESWAIINPNGQSELGFYPLYLEKQTFVLIINGSPRLQGEDFIIMLQLLIQRYV